MKRIAILLAVALATSLTATSCGSHEDKCKSLGGVIETEPVYDAHGNWDHDIHRCITHNGDVVDEWDGK